MSISLFFETISSRNKLKKGTPVLIIKKEDQKINKTTKGVVQDILTNKKNHSRGIKVRLKSGDVGRVKKILD